MHHRPVIFLSLLWLAACSGRDAAPPAATSNTAAPATEATARHADAPGITWFEGDVDAAFAAARAQHKPVFLYWGAIWCPPCHQIKATVFLRPDFIEKTKLFIPVYLDGDDEGAQKWGEQFRVTGYPTLVVLSAARAELMRIAGGMDLEQYASVLDLALGEIEPVSSILSAAAKGKTLTGSDCKRLAYNAWVLEDLPEAEYGKFAAELQSAARQCPNSEAGERARLNIVAAFFAAEAEAESLKAGAKPSARLQQGMQAVTAVLADPAVAGANTDVLTYLSENFFRAVQAGGPQQARAFYAAFIRVMDEAARSTRFAEAGQLSAIATKLDASKTLNGRIDPAFAKEAQDRLAAMLVAKHSDYVRSSIINAALGIYELLGLNEQAYRLVQAELPNSATPYYYKADLASLAEALGRKDEALKWSAEAYAESRGTATRFQWGRLYLTSLLRLAPDDTARIQSVGTQVLGELDGNNRIYQRARTRLVTLDDELRKWSAGNASRGAVLQALRRQMQQTCTKIPAADAARRSCDAFLAGA